MISITDDKEIIDVEFVWSVLRECFWSKDIPRSILEKSIQHSFCASAFYNDTQVGFARVITDYSTYGYICDVITHTDYRQQGVCTALLDYILSHKELQGFKTWSLVSTKASNSIYRKKNFVPIEKPKSHLEINDLSIYRKATQ